MTLPKLHIRDLLWLVLVAGMGCAWWLDRGRLNHRLANQEERLQHIISRLTDTDLRNLYHSGREESQEGGHTYSVISVEVVPAE